MRQEQGYTLLDTALTATLLCMLLPPALNGIATFYRNNQLATTSNAMLGILNTARFEAVSQKKPVSICSGTTQCLTTRDWKNQIIIFTDSNQNGLVDGDDKILLAKNIGNGNSWTWKSFRKRHHLTYKADGMTAALNGTLTDCHDKSSQRAIIVNLAGRPRLEKRSPSKC